MTLSMAETRHQTLFPMIGNHSTPSLRAISIIGAVQTGVVVAGTLVVTAGLKMAGYGTGLVPDWFFNQTAVSIRDRGLFLLFVPAVWVAAAVLVARSSTRAWAPGLMILFGIALVFYGLYWYGLLFLHPCIL